MAETPIRYSTSTDNRSTTTDEEEGAVGAQHFILPAQHTAMQALLRSTDRTPVQVQHTARHGGGHQPGTRSRQCQVTSVTSTNRQFTCSIPGC